MKNFRKFFDSKWTLAGVLAVGIAARIFLAGLGQNFDFDSYRIVVGILDHGGNVYAQTDRYNYGPIWFNILYALNFLAGNNPISFHYWLAGFLTAVDVGIFFVLRRAFGNLAACLFFLNPISIIISGYHCQFDNLALLFGFSGVLLIGDNFGEPVGRRKFFGLLVLGLSLMTKHLLFAFPFWLAVKQKGFGQKCAVFFLPAACFALGFIPYWHEGKQGIINNVFLYHSFHTEFFYKFLLPLLAQYFLDSRTIWFLMLVLFAFICRKKNSIESLLFYTAVLVATAPATANQYLAIPVAFVSAFVNFWTILYTVVGTLHLATSRDEPAFAQNLPGGWDDMAICILFFALIWTTWREPLLAATKAIIKKCRDEIKIQFDS